MCVEMIALKIQVAIIMFWLETIVYIWELINLFSLGIIGTIWKSHFALSATNIAQNVPTTLLILANHALMDIIFQILHAFLVI